MNKILKISNNILMLFTVISGILICVLSCIYFFLESLFSFGSLKAGYEVEMWLGVVCHLVGALSCIYTAYRFCRKKDKGKGDGGQETKRLVPR